MRNNLLCFFGSLAFLISPAAFQNPAAAQSSPIDPSLAHQYFQEAQAISQQDNGKLWKTPLYGPMIFADRETRAVVANQADREGKLVKQGNVFVGTLPKQENIANTAMKWAGVEWTMVVWPLPDDRQDRIRLMMHELFHRVQDDLGFPGLNPANQHLDARDGRIWLQMEWRALANALAATGAQRRKAVEDALLFRSYRRSLFPQAASEERALEINEGLAEYTGVKLGAQSNAEATLVAGCGLMSARRRSSFVRSFAYVSGPAYGALLDESAANWRQSVKAGDDLGMLLHKAFSMKLPQATQAEAMKRTHSYDGEALIAAETQRDNLRQQQLAKYRARFFEQRALTLPFTDKGQYSFDPNNVVAFDDNRTIYPTLRVSDAWGVLEVSKGALLVREGGLITKVIVPAPDDLNARPLKGDGWTLELQEGWRLVPGERQGDLVMKKME